MEHAVILTTLFNNTVFQVKHKLYIASGSAPPNEKFWVRTGNGPWYNADGDRALLDIDKRHPRVTYQQVNYKTLISVSLNIDG